MLLVVVAHTMLAVGAWRLRPSPHIYHPPVSGAELTNDSDANVPQRELDRTTAAESNISIKHKLEVSG